MNRVLLLNPPAKNSLQRDFLCSSSSKASYYWPPIDFIVLSGLLKEFEVRVIDAVASKISNTETLSKLKAMNPDSIISLVSSIGFNEEMTFLKKVKDSFPNSRIILIGDIAFFEKEKVIKNKFVDAILLDFTSHQIIEYLKNPENRRIKDVCYKIGNKIIFNGMLKSSEFSYNHANLELFNLNSYSIPYSIHKKIAPILFNYGCPYKCSFCASGNIGYKIRNLSESKQEIIHLYKKGFKEIFIRDFNFTTNKLFVTDICRFIIKNNLRISWSCEGRVDNVDKESLLLMKKAGCYLIFFGVESGKQEKLDNFQKKISLAQIKKVFRLCREIGIKTLASFVLALPGDTREDIMATINLSKEIDADYASFNLYVPRYGSNLRKSLEKNSKLDLNSKFDSSKEFINLTALPEEEILKLHRHAVRSFYFRLPYMAKQVRSMKTWFQFKNHFLNGLSLFKNS